MTGGQPAFRPLTRADLPTLAGWLGAPHVAAWWHDPHGPDDLEAAYGPVVDGTDPTEVRIVTVDGTDVGLVQRYLLADEPAWRDALAPAGVPDDAFGIDYLLGDPAATGRGLGTRVIAAFVAGSWTRYPETPACVVAVHADNAASLGALRRAGFAAVWRGGLATDDPGDAGPHVVLVQWRPAAA